MRGMRKLLLLACVCLIGCGGSGGGGTQPPAGHFTGTWGAVNEQVTPPPGDSGTFDLTINGIQVEGTCHNTGKNETGNVSGTFQNGLFDLVVDYPTSDDWEITNRPPPYEQLSVSGSRIQGTVQVATEEYNRTIHSFPTKIVLNRQ